jgi:ribosomal protein S18 acetylase RimI-like enzyme
MDITAVHLPAGYALRDRTEGDLAFLCALYAGTREEEMRPLGWTQEATRAFLADQFARQHAHYLQHYPKAAWWIVTFEGERVGRFYCEQTPRDLRVMDVALVPAHRNRGVGSALMRSALDEARRAGVPCSLHVEPFNPALRLYVRLGFEHVETRGVYLFMEKRPSVEDDLVARSRVVARDGNDEHVEPAVHGVHQRMDALLQQGRSGAGEDDREGLGARGAARQVAQLHDVQRQARAAVLDAQGAGREFAEVQAGEFVEHRRRQVG